MSNRLIGLNKEKEMLYTVSQTKLSQTVYIIGPIGLYLMRDHIILKLSRYFEN